MTWQEAKEKVLDGFESYDGVSDDGVVDALIAAGDALEVRLQAAEREREDFTRTNEYLHRFSKENQERAEALEVRLQAALDGLKRTPCNCQKIAGKSAYTC